MSQGEIARPSDMGLSAAAVERRLAGPWGTSSPPATMSGGRG